MILEDNPFFQGHRQNQLLEKEQTYKPQTFIVTFTWSTTILSATTYENKRIVLFMYRVIQKKKNKSTQIRLKLGQTSITQNVARTLGVYYNKKTSETVRKF